VVGCTGFYRSYLGTFHRCLFRSFLVTDVRCTFLPNVPCIVPAFAFLVFLTSCTTLGFFNTGSACLHRHLLRRHHPAGINVSAAAHLRAFTVDLPFPQLPALRSLAVFCRRVCVSRAFADAHNWFAARLFQFYHKFFHYMLGTPRNVHARTPPPIFYHCAPCFCCSRHHLWIPYTAVAPPTCCGTSIRLRFLRVR